MNAPSFPKNQLSEAVLPVCTVELQLRCVTLFTCVAFKKRTVSLLSVNSNLSGYSGLFPWVWCVNSGVLFTSLGRSVRDVLLLSLSEVEGAAAVACCCF